MIENSEQALAYLEAVVAGEIAPENPECREAALIVTRTLRQATQTLADHAQAAGVPGVREGDGAGVSDESLRRLAEEWTPGCKIDGIFGILWKREVAFDSRLSALLRRVAEEARREEQKRWLALYFDGKHPAECDCPNCGYGL